MTDAKRLQRNHPEIEELARGWGKLLAREAFPDGVGLDVDLFAMEEIAVTAAKSLVRGAVETMTDDQTQALGTEHPCPGCGKLCQLDQRWTCRAQGTGGSLLDVSSRFFSLCVPS